MSRRQSSPMNDPSDLETVNSSMVVSESQPQWENAQVQEDDDEDDMKPQHDNSDGEQQVEADISPEIIIPDNSSPKVDHVQEEENKNDEEEPELKEEEVEKHEEEEEQPHIQEEKEVEEEPTKEEEEEMPVKEEEKPAEEEQE